MNSIAPSRFHHWATEFWYGKLLSSLETAEAQGDRARCDLINESLRNIVVVNSEDLVNGRVQFASLVTVFSTTEEEEQSFQIVSADEARAYPEGRLSCEAPLAQALIGTREGELVQIVLSNGAECEYEVTHIRIP